MNTRNFVLDGTSAQNRKCISLFIRQVRQVHAMLSVELPPIHQRFDSDWGTEMNNAMNDFPLTNPVFPSRNCLSAYFHSFIAREDHAQPPIGQYQDAVTNLWLHHLNEPKRGAAHLNSLRAMMLTRECWNAYEEKGALARTGKDGCAKPFAATNKKSSLGEIFLSLA